MKLTKAVGIVSVAAALVLGTSNSKADPGFTTNSSAIHVSLTVITNGVEHNSGNVYHYPVNRTKITNKTLLAEFASWADTSWPAGAKIVVGWDNGNFGGHFGDVLVVDKTGTNVLFNATAGYWSDSSYYFYLDFWYELGAYEGNYVDNTPGSETYKSYNSSYFQLYDNVNAYSYLWSYGGDVQHFFQSWDSNGGKNWADTENANFPLTGDQYWNGAGSLTTVRGQITADGHGKGYNYLGIAND